LLHANREVRKIRAAAELPVSETDLFDQSMALTRLRRMHPKLGAKIVDPPSSVAKVAINAQSSDATPIPTPTGTSMITGVRLNNIVVGGAAHRAGIHNDDKVMLVNGVAMTNVDEFASTLEGCTPGDYLTLHILRKDKWWKPKPPKKVKKKNDDDDEDEEEEEEEDEEDEEELEEKAAQPEEDEDDDDEEDDDNSSKKVVVGASSGRGGAPAKGILKGKAAGSGGGGATAKESKDISLDTPRSGDAPISGPMSVRWRRRYHHTLLSFHITHVISYLN
jgi:hypothetical protein